MRGGDRAALFLKMSPEIWKPHSAPLLKLQKYCSIIFGWKAQVTAAGESPSMPTAENVQLSFTKQSVSREVWCRQMNRLILRLVGWLIHFYNGFIVIPIQLHPPPFLNTLCRCISTVLLLPQRIMWAFCISQWTHTVSEFHLNKSCYPFIISTHPEWHEFHYTKDCG